MCIMHYLGSHVNWTTAVRVLGISGLMVISFIWDTTMVTSETGTTTARDIYEMCIVKRIVEKNGYHRDLRTIISIPEDMLKGAGNNPNIVINEHIPSGMYIDLYQTRAGEDFGGPKVHSSVDIDVEKPEFLSPHHNVHVFNQLEHRGPLYTSETVLPVHLRYHKPDEQEQFTKVVLEPPEVLIEVTDAKKSVDDQLQQIVCDSSGTSYCTWRKIECTFEPNNGVLQFSVPVGQKSHSNLVVSVTLVITIAATIFLGHSIIYKRKNAEKLKNN